MAIRVGLRPISKGMDEPPNPKASYGETGDVTEQKSAEGIVVQMTSEAI